MPNGLKIEVFYRAFPTPFFTRPQVQRTWALVAWAIPGLPFLGLVVLVFLTARPRCGRVESRSAASRTIVPFTFLAQWTAGRAAEAG